MNKSKVKQPFMFIIDEYDFYLVFEALRKFGWAL